MPEAAAALEQPALLEMRAIEKSFGGVHALAGVDFSVRPGEIHALLGENGAGKSTLVKILAGVHARDDGTVAWEGRDLDSLGLSLSRDLGIRIIYQQLSTVPHLTVGQNLVLGRERHHYGYSDVAAERRAAAAALGRLGVAMDLDRPAGTLRVAERQLIEIARALADGGVRLLLMDEPTASLGEHEVERLFDVIRGLRDEGIAVVYISHKLDEVFAISERITVLRDGRTIGTVVTRDVTPDACIAMMVGRTLRHDVQHQTHATDDVVLEATDLWTTTGLKGISLQLHRGEVLGVYGLMGSGRTELARALFGADPITSGAIRVRGKPVRLRGPGDAKRHGMGLVPEERAHASFPLLSVRENITAASTDLFSRLAWLNPGRERALAGGIIERLRVKTPTSEEPISRLSGGNQQKVIVGRWLVRQTPILILDDPTAGVDVGAKDELYRLIGEMTARGTSVIVSSSELPELLALADRMLVLHEGSLAGILSGEAMTQRAVMELAVRGSTAPAADRPAPGSIAH
jgi:ribose transport system ATP-binding protein